MEDVDHVLVLVFPSIDVEPLLVDFVGDSVPDLAAEHHCAAPHVVIHYVFESWFISIFINGIEEDLLVGGDLNSHISFDVIDKPTGMDCVVLLPLSAASDVVDDNFEK